MVRSVVLMAALAVGATSLPAPAEAGKISRACLQADRKAATRSLCGCIQAVANQSLTRSEQRLAAKFFRDPHMAQEIRQSDLPRNERFWEKYKAFGRTAEAVCRGA
ncbi:hypothetical protein [Pseudaestuariivita sp.]|uniref:hypothetical protein n=1 Tax=Pseudaestuariivita sp. TaxID=2211669 RepID=UPI004059E5AA